MNKNIIVVLAIAAMALIAILAVALIWSGDGQNQTVQSQPTQRASLEKSSSPKIESSVILKPSTPINPRFFIRPIL